MQQAAVTLCYCCSLLAVSTIVQGLSLNEKWNSWKEEHGKHFSSEVEETKRLKIWIKNLESIEEHNQQNHSFTLKMNHLGDLVNIEYFIYLDCSTVKCCTHYIHSIFDRFHCVLFQ